MVLQFTFVERPGITLIHISLVTGENQTPILLIVLKHLLCSTRNITCSLVMEMHYIIKLQKVSKTVRKRIEQICNNKKIGTGWHKNVITQCKGTRSAIYQWYSVI